MRGRVPRALLEAACCEGAVGGLPGNREVVVVCDGRTRHNVVPLPLPAVEELLTRACATVVTQLRRSKTTTTEERACLNICATTPHARRRHDFAPEVAAAAVQTTAVDILRAATTLRRQTAAA